MAAKFFKTVCQVDTKPERSFFLPTKPNSLSAIIPLRVYPFDVMLSFGEDDDSLRKRLVRYDISDENTWMYASDNEAARCCSFKGNQTLIRVRKIPKTNEEYSFLQHEIFHAVTIIMWKIGMKLIIGKSDEAYAYLVGFLTKEIYDKIR